MYHVQVWRKRYRWAWLDRLLTEPVTDHIHNTARDAMHCVSTSIEDNSLGAARVNIRRASQ